MTRTVTLALLGDVMLGRGVGAEIPRRAPESFWGDVRDDLLAADAVLANLECAVTEHRRRWRRTPKVFHFKAPPEAVAVLRAGGVKAVSLANNHILDWEEEGLRDTVRHLDGAGIAHAGAGKTLAEAATPAVVEAGGLRLALVAMTDNERGWAADPDTPGVNWIPIATDAPTLATLDARIAAARRIGADLVVLSLHWGPNMVERPRPVFRAFARAALDLGADVVWGHSAHIFQGVECHGRRPILYDTGDFLDDYAVDPRLRNDLSLLWLLDLEGGRPRRLRLLPVRLGCAVVERARGEDRAWIVRRMRALSAELGAQVTEVEGDPFLHVPIPAGAEADG